jgi:hypothetical protein
LINITEYTKATPSSDTTDSHIEPPVKRHKASPIQLPQEMSSVLIPAQASIGLHLTPFVPLANVHEIEELLAGD